MTSADEKLPQWFRLRTNDMDTPAGRYMLAGGSTSDWASYGRWFALRQILATTPGAYVDVSDQRQLRALARQLGFSGPKACRTWLDALAHCGAIAATDYETGEVTDPDVYNQQMQYVESVKRARRNGSKSGAARPPDDQGGKEADPGTDAGA